MKRLHVYAVASAAQAASFQFALRKQASPLAYAIKEGDLVALVGPAFGVMNAERTHDAVCRDLTLHELVLDEAQQAFR